MAIYQDGTINTAGLVTPGVNILITPPKVVKLNGVATNVLGVVGVASWGPLNQRITLGGYGQFEQYFGAMADRPHDAGTDVYIAELQGVKAFEVVRVANGTENKAVANVQGTGLQLSALYHGTKGNTIRSWMATGTKNGTWKFVVSISGQIPETFDNIGFGLSGNALWAEIARVINNGDGYRSASQLVVATAGASTAAPTVTPSNSPVVLSGGSDGTTGVNSATLLGADGETRTGMYALRGGDASVLLLSGATDHTTWAAQLAFGLTEGMYVHVAGPAGQSVSTTKANKNAAGVDSYAIKVLAGDHLYWRDPVNKKIRLSSPAAFSAGRTTALAPHESGLNKPIFGVIGSQKVGAPETGIDNSYSDAEKQAIITAGLDVISNKSPGGNYWSLVSGTNSSSDPAVNGDNYTRMTNFIAKTLNGGLGRYIGRPINLSMLNNVRATINNFLNNLLQQGILAPTLQGKTPFQVVCDATNNIETRVSEGYVQVDVKVQYQSITRFLLVKLEGGQTVSVEGETVA